MTELFHLAVQAEWQAALEAGQPYAQSTRGLGLDEVGFIHLAYRHQVAQVANAFYADCVDPLCVLLIDPASLSADVVDEAVGDQRFPHAYGPIDLAAVTAVRAYAPGPDGRFPEFAPDDLSPAISHE